MREILFKAKRDGSGEWVEGCYAECKGKTFIGIGISICIDAFKGFVLLQLGGLKLLPKPSASSRDFATRTGREFGRMTSSSMAQLRLLLSLENTVMEI